MLDRLHLSFRRLAGTLLLAGLACGQKYALPPQPPKQGIPDLGYNLFATWQMPGRPTDLASRSGYVYVILDSLTVRAYLDSVLTPIPSSFVAPFEGLRRPVQICMARGADTYLFVADLGDSTVKRYSYTGGPPILAFTDVRWHGRFSGLAADNNLNVYVAYGDTIARYDELGRRVTVLNDQGRPIPILADNQTGSGQVNRPKGLFWFGSILLVADSGTSLVKQLRPDRFNAPAGSPIGVDVPHLNSPQDVTSDLAYRSVLVADTGNDRILKFSVSGALIDSVYSIRKSLAALPGPIHRPAFVAAARNLVYVSDPVNSRVVVFLLNE